MEDQGRRLLLAVGIAFALMLGWQYLNPPEEPKLKPKPDATAEADIASGGDGAQTAVAPSRSRTIRRGEERRFAFEFADYSAELSSYGAALTSWTLAGEAFEDRTKDGNPQMDLVRTADEEAWRPLSIWFADSSYGIPSDVEWSASKVADRSIEFTWESPQIRVTKRFEFHPADYSVAMTVEIEKLVAGNAEQSLAVSMFGYETPGQEESGSSFGRQLTRAWEAVCYVAGDDMRMANLKELAEGDRGQVGSVKWAGFAHSYFLAAIAPRADSGDRLACHASATETRDGAMETVLLHPRVTLTDTAPSYSWLVVGYFGPKFFDRLEAVATTVGCDPSFETSVDLGFLRVISEPLLWLMRMFYDFVGNWGIAIILLTVVVQALTLPWTAKSMRSMKEMAKLRPQLEKLKEKHGDDKQAHQAAMMNLYKTHKINPLAGCLPMLLQMPIWFALYRTLSVAAELYQVAFIPGWLDDLTAPDPLYIMPVLLLGMMFLQTKLQPSPVESTQQKVMMYGMPAMFGFFALFFPSGLTLYILTNTVLRTSHQLYLNRTDKTVGPAAGGKSRPDSTDPKTKGARASENSDQRLAASTSPKRASGAGKKTKRKSRKKTGGRAAKA